MDDSTTFRVPQNPRSTTITSSNTTTTSSSLSTSSPTVQNDYSALMELDNFNKVIPTSSPQQLQVNSFAFAEIEMKSNSCSMDDADSAAAFLAKRPLGHTYLDLDSRCIAL